MDAVFDLALARLEAIVASGATLTEVQKRQFARELRDSIVAEADAVRIMGEVRSPDEIAAAAARALDQQAAVTDCLARNDLSQGLAKAEGFLERHAIALGTESFECRRLARDLLVAMQQAFTIVARQERGDFSDLDQPGFTSPVLPAPAPMSDGIRTPEQFQQDRALATAPFSTHAKALTDAKTAAGKWGWDQCSDSAAAHRLFIAIIGDKPVIQYSSDDAIKFLRALQRMPVGVNQREPYIGLSASKAIEKADQIEARQIKAAKAKIAAQKLRGAEADRLLSEARKPRISTTTVLKHRDNVAAVFKYLQSRLHVATKNPFDGIRPDRVGKSDLRDQRARFSAEQIRGIFSSPIWVGSKSRYYITAPGKIVLKDHRYWIPLIACLTGMRPEEICQLWLDDIVKESGIHCFDIWAGPERQLKTPASERRVPVPDLLLRLGLLERVEALRSKGEYRLFPELKRSSKTDPRTGLGKLGPSLTRCLGRYFDHLELADVNQTFYSLRHTFASALREAGVAIEDIRDLIGHKQAGSESERRYVKRRRVLQLKELIERLDYGLTVVERNGEAHLSVREDPAACPPAPTKARGRARKQAPKPAADPI